MKKTILILFCLAIILMTVSCNIDKTSLETLNEDNSIDEKQSTQEVSNSDSSNQKNEQESQIKVAFDTYDSIIHTYKKMVEIAPDVIEEKEIFNETVKSIFNVEETKKEWFSQLTTSISTLYPKDAEGLKNNGYADFGYSVKDINKDNFDELILMVSNGTIIAIFTTYNEEPVLLDSFQNRYSCSLNSDGDIFISGSNGASKTVNRRYTLDLSTRGMILVCEYGTDGLDNITGETMFYVSINSEKNYLTESEYDEFCENNKAMTSSQLLEFISYKQLFE